MASGEVLFFQKFRDPKAQIRNIKSVISRRYQQLLNGSDTEILSAAVFYPCPRRLRDINSALFKIESFRSVYAGRFFLGQYLP
jgi:hypothetical protein